LQQDKLIRNYLFARFSGITQIRIERTKTELIIFVHSPNTSLITGESNDNSDAILAKVAQIVNDQKIITKLHLVTERDIYSSAQAIANDLAQQLKNRVSCRSALRDLLFKLGQGVR
jgi:ribosomal protein S3